MRIALLQIEIETGRRSANLSRINEWVDRACDADPAPDLVVLPECCDLGLIPNDLSDLSEPVGGAFCESLSAKTREMGVCLAAGITERGVDGVHSAAVLFDEDGDVLLRHRRIHLPEPLHGPYTPGSRLDVRRALGTTVGLGLGDDVKLACLPGALSAMGAGLMILPAAVSVPARDGQEARRAWFDALTAAARAASIGVLCAGAVGVMEDGPAQGKALIGGSAAVGPDGRIWAQADDDGSAALMADLDLVDTPAPTAG